MLYKVRYAIPPLRNFTCLALILHRLYFTKTKQKEIFQKPPPLYSILYKNTTLTNFHTSPQAVTFASFDDLEANGANFASTSQNCTSAMLNWL